MGMTHLKTPRLKRLLDKVPPGFMVDAAWLKGQEGIDPKSIHEYVERGWLERVVRGVYRRPLPESVVKTADADWQVALLSLQWILNEDVHLGGESALDLAGYAHYLSLGNKPRVHLYGNVPSWIKRLPGNTQFILHNRRLFGDTRIGIIEATNNGQSGLQTVNIWEWPIKSSSPERAILEALDELSEEAGFDRLDKTFEGLTSLRPKVLTELLMACTSVKVRRLFFVFADRHQHAWRKHLDTSKLDFGSGPRALVKGGKIHPVYRIYVPADFIPASNTEGADA